MITYMTPSRIEFEYDGQSYTVHGEALNPDYGLDYVIYGDDMHFTEESRRGDEVEPMVRREVLNRIAAELAAKGTRFEIESTADVDLGDQPHQARVVAPAPSPASGLWFTPASVNSRRYFKQGEVMPDIGGAWGTTVWQWDERQ